MTQAGIRQSPVIMNSIDILRYGHETVKEAIADLPDNEWQMAGVCGHWSVKEVVDHLASYEHLLIEVLRSLLEDAPLTPTLDRLLDDEQFNDDEVAQRQELTIAESWRGYEIAHETAVALLTQIPPEQQRLNGALPWYGGDYDLEDFLVYTYYGHKREHSAQIAAFRDAIPVTA